MSELIIKSNELASALFGGFASDDFKEAFVAPFRLGFVFAENLSKAIVNQLSRVTNFFQDGLSFFMNWMQDDPLAATAGAGAVLLTGGVLLLGGGTILGAVGGGIGTIKAAIGLAISGITVLGVTGMLGPLIRWAIRGVQFIWNFNFNVTDKEIRAQQEGLVKSLYGQAGEALGSTLGTLLCGSAPVELVKKSNLVRVNPMILARIREITQFDPASDEYGELYDEMMDNLKALVNAGTRVGSQIAFIESYKNIRKWIKNSNAFGLGKIFPGLGRLLQTWGEEGSQPWSFALKQEEFIESIEDSSLQEFTEEFLESFMESCTESTMIVSYLF